MPITQAESHHISVLAGQGETTTLRTTVTALAVRENTTPGAVLLACRDDYHQTAAHMASKAGQAQSIHALAGLFGADAAGRAAYFNIANRFSGDGPVHTALRHRYLEPFRALVKHGADPTRKNRFGDAWVDYAPDFEEGEVAGVVEAYRKRMDAGGL
ncbi:hypothetical protein P8C59_007701 [Phyllachora maydis]|uniref:Ankyrin repeat domain-containing protein n=1 Tax=Phyllachora maydis TaxID=1825666 RepID=A0AAD9IA92_9PEZI|nr:hypothetical protein P8C59_007701 [Phyllachora maydis]